MMPIDEAFITLPELKGAVRLYLMSSFILKGGLAHPNFTGDRSSCDPNLSVPDNVSLQWTVHCILYCILYPKPVTCNPEFSELLQQIIEPEEETIVAPHFQTIGRTVSNLAPPFL